MKKDEETDKDMVRDKIPSVEITILGEVVEMVEICFDPDDMNTLIEQDKEVMTQYFEFEKMVDECMTTMAPVSGGVQGEEGEELIEELISSTAAMSLNKASSGVGVGVGAGAAAATTEAQQQQQQQQAPNEKSKWIIRMTMNKEEMLDRLQCGQFNFPDSSQ